jgi:hypothetical protein
MSFVEIRDHVIWTKHVGNTALENTLLNLAAGREVELVIDGSTGVWEKMADSNNGRPTNGIKPTGAAKFHWAALQGKRGERVEIALSHLPPVANDEQPPVTPLVPSEQAPKLQRPRPAGPPKCPDCRSGTVRSRVMIIASGTRDSNSSGAWITNRGTIGVGSRTGQSASRLAQMAAGNTSFRELKQFGISTGLLSLLVMMPGWEWLSSLGVFGLWCAGSVFAIGALGDFFVQKDNRYYNWMCTKCGCLFRFAEGQKNRQSSEQVAVSCLKTSFSSLVIYLFKPAAFVGCMSIPTIWPALEHFSLA